MSTVAVSDIETFDIYFGNHRRFIYHLLCVCVTCILLGIIYGELTLTQHNINVVSEALNTA